MNYVYTFIFINMSMMMALGSIFMITSIKLKFSRNKLSIFECGMDLMNNPRLPFSLHFFFISIIFLIFDVELMMILPFIFCMKSIKTKIVIMMISLLMAILIISLIYEWWSGIISWMI